MDVNRFFIGLERLGPALDIFGFGAAKMKKRYSGYKEGDCKLTELAGDFTKDYVVITSGVVY
jgi:hypothetical protein